MTINNQAGSSQTTEKNAMDSKSNLENFEKYLKGLAFPTEKKHLIEQAKKNGAPQTMLDALNKLKEQKYETQSEVTKYLYH